MIRENTKYVYTIVAFSGLEGWGDSQKLYTDGCQATNMSSNNTVCPKILRVGPICANSQILHVFLLRFNSSYRYLYFVITTDRYVLFNNER